MYVSDETDRLALAGWYAHRPIGFPVCRSLTLMARAMKQDKEKCVQAGASDYLSKSVDIDRLLAMIRIWLYR